MKEYSRNLIKKVVSICAPKFYTYLFIGKNMHVESGGTNYSSKTGWAKSYKSANSLDANGKSIPWMNNAIVNFLEERLRKDMKLFEYGSGSSTTFFADRVQEVVSVEYDKEWLDKVAKNGKENVRLLYKNVDKDGEYAHSIQKFAHMDIVIVDGRDRVNCVKAAEKNISETSVIILDDSERERYKEAFLYMSAKKFKQLSFTGLKNGSFTWSQATIFYKEKNVFDI